MVAYPKIDLKVIPNFSLIDDSIHYKTNNKLVKIIFARRLFVYRGTRIFASALKELLNLDYQIDVTIAGEGPDESYLRHMFADNTNVHFTKYDSSQSMDIHADKDIAIIPTIGSEGTSLSLLEAMASKCAVICTNVGGMTNIVLNRHNGLLINPNEKELLHSLVELIENENLRAQLAIEGFKTVNNAFSLDLWKTEWKQLFEEIIADINN